MNWLIPIVDELIKRHPSGVITVSSGVSPSGTYHLGTLREVLTAEVVAIELRRRNREARHLHIVDDLDVFRKVPANISAEFEQYLGKPLCDVPSPDGSDRSYAEYFLADLIDAQQKMNLSMEIIRSHEKYRSGFFVPAIETALDRVVDIRTILEDVSGRALDNSWTPIQILEDGYLKNRQFVSIDTSNKTVTYIGKDNTHAVANYEKGDVKLSWRIDWPARWSLLNVNAEPFGRDHATKGGSYDTGALIVRDIYGAEPPYPIPYHFVNRTGETKKMSKSAGNVITAAQLLEILPPEIVWFFILRYSPDKQLFFDEQETLMRLFDEFAELLAKQDKSDQEQHLIDLCLHDVAQPTVSNIPFTHMVASYQAALRDEAVTLDIIRRTEHAETAQNDEDTIRRELRFIDAWLEHSAPEEVKFSIVSSINDVDINVLSDVQKQFLHNLADTIESAPSDADGDWFHKAIYQFKDTEGLGPKDLFGALYRVLINKDYGPRAGWFLSTLDKEMLVDRLRLKA